MLDVPIEKKASHFSVASTAFSSASGGSVSPNQTTSGRKLPPQDRHRPRPVLPATPEPTAKVGSTVEGSTSKLSFGQSFSKQRKRCRFPCSSTIRLLPARA